MTKSELIETVAKDTGMTKAGAKEVYEAFMSRIQEGLKQEGRFEVHGLGVFKTKKRPAREKFNPRNGNPVHVPADVAVRFKAHKGLTDFINA